MTNRSIPVCVCVYTSSFHLTLRGSKLHSSDVMSCRGAERVERTKVIFLSFIYQVSVSLSFYYDKKRGEEAKV